MGLTTDRSDPGLHAHRADGQQETYLILSEEERAKGFVRPLRLSYRHVVCGQATHMNEAIAETYARDNLFYSHTFCVQCHAHYPLVNLDGTHAFTWEPDGTPVGS